MSRVSRNVSQTRQSVPKSPNIFKALIYFGIKPKYVKLIFHF
jgi:hypothetical protein